MSVPSFTRSSALLIAISIPAIPAFAGKHDSDLPNFQKVNEQVYRGGQPSEAGFQNIAKLGVKTVIDLRLIGEHSQAEEQRIVESQGMRYVSVPMRGMSAPTSEQLTKVLGLMNDPAAGPVFIHCRRGADRTGTVIACYRIGHDNWANEKALQEAKQMGMAWIEKAMQHYVMDYAPARPAVTIEAATAAPKLPALAPAAP